MKLTSYLICLSGITTATASVIPESAAVSVRSLSESTEHTFDLVKRRGGGGGRGGGGSSGGSRGSSSSSSSSTRVSSGGFRPGAGVRPYLGGGRYYGGGAGVPFAAGGLSPRARINPVFIAAPALAFGGLWLYGAYAYPYGSPYSFRNESRQEAQNQTLPVQCVCSENLPCGCDDNGDRTYLDTIVGNGTIANSTLASVVNVNGTDTLVINGTLPEGTTADEYVSGAVRLGGPGEFSGWWMMLATVGSIIYFC